METLGSVDDLLDFSSDIGEDDNDNDKPRKCSDPPSLNPLDVGDPNHSSSELEEEELEWLSNKDAFPAVETFVELTSIQPIIPQHQRTMTAPLLEYNTSSNNCWGVQGSTSNDTNIITLLSDLKVPVRARSKSRSRPRAGLADGASSQKFSWRQPSSDISKEAIIERKCHHCGAEKTPLWRSGPHGPKTLCNACGVRFKAGRLVPEYRPASSPTFRSDLHSNYHKKIVKMRKQKQKK